MSDETQDLPPGSAQGYSMPPGVPPEIAEKLRAVAPGLPPYVVTDAERERWELAALTAAGIAVDQGDGLSLREQQIAAWGLARSLYRMDDELPLGEPPVAPDAAAA